MPDDKQRRGPDDYKKLSPRELAIWQHASGKTYLDPYYTVTVNLDRKLLHWLFENLVGTEVAYGDLEETILTSLRQLRAECLGDDPDSDDDDEIYVLDPDMRKELFPGDEASKGAADDVPF